MVLIVIALCLFGVGTVLAFKIRRENILRQQAVKKRIVRKKPGPKRIKTQPVLFTQEVLADIYSGYPTAEKRQQIKQQLIPDDLSGSDKTDTCYKFENMSSIERVSDQFSSLSFPEECAIPKRILSS